MSQLVLHDFHQARGASFTLLNGCEAVAHYQSPQAEYSALTQGAALVDLGFRGRICLLGADREKFLHGQVTNDILRLKAGQGCYALLVTAKGKIQSDLFIYKLADELLLDFEPGLSQGIQDRLNKYIIAEAVEVVDVAPHYGMLAVCGPGAAKLLENCSSVPKAPSTLFAWSSISSEGGDVYLMQTGRWGVPEYDLFVPIGSLAQVAHALEEAGRQQGAAWVGLNACETVRIENGIPRFGADMTEATLPQEAELQDRAISFAKGCYIGQEVIARIRTYGQVAKALRLIQLDSDLDQLPSPGTKIFTSGKEVGFITSATASPKLGGTVALAYVRKESNAPGAELELEEPRSGRARIIRIAGSPS